MYADDTCIVFSANSQEDLQRKINSDTTIIEQWFTNNLLTINEKKTEFLIFTRKKEKPQVTIFFNNKQITQTQEVQYLGLTIQENLKWDKHVEQLINKNAKTIAAVRKVRNIIPIFLRKSIYNSLYKSNASYMMNVWSDTSQINITKLQRQQNRVLKTLHSLDRLTPTLDLHSITDELTVEQQIKLNRLLLVYKIQQRQIKTDIKLQTAEDTHQHNTRSAPHLRTERFKTAAYAPSIQSNIATIYNNLDSDMKNLKYQTFKLKLRSLIKNGII